jgi:hypothetical protein
MEHRSDLWNVSGLAQVPEERRDDILVSRQDELLREIHEIRVRWQWG